MPYTLADRRKTAYRAQPLGSRARGSRQEGGMAQVETTAGPIDAGDLGKTLIHEHFRGRDEAVAHQWPHVYDADEEWNACVAAVEGLKQHGVNTVVEPTAMLLGRNAPLLQRISSETGLQIVACTGIY